LPKKQLKAGTKLEIISILGLGVYVSTLEDMTDCVIEWVRERKPRFVCVANVHSTMEAWDKPEFQRALNSADVVLADGQPLVWAQNLLGAPEAQRVRGPDLMNEVCSRAARAGIPIGLYGGRASELDKLKQALQDRYPGIQIPVAIAPPFRPLTAEEDKMYTDMLNDSRVSLVFVGLGCPKQELWIANHRENVPAVMIGVGAAFDLLSRRMPTSPDWMRNHGLEWLFRLCREPRRLWKRYVKHNPRFIILFAWQLLKASLSD
jgi:N-acetylglucosaminyldiphosphoundecaprenol N-acetyl-beta-D-mannosaminyltransferase